MIGVFQVGLARQNNASGILTSRTRRTRFPVDSIMHPLGFHAPLPG